MPVNAYFWVIADGHRPIYTTSIGDGVVSVAQSLRNSLEPLLLKYQVNGWPSLPCFYGSFCFSQVYLERGHRDAEDMPGA